MSQSIDQAFIKQFESEVHEAYQQRGSKLRGLVRTKTGVIGKSTTFQKVGKGEAGVKARHGKVPVMDIDHTPVECTLTDYYTGDFADKLDEAKVNIDERRVLVNAGAFALGRKSDELIIDALGGTSHSTTVTMTSLATIKDALFSARAALGDREVPDDGMTFAAVSWRMWSVLMSINEFVSSDWTGPDLPFTRALAGLQKRTWLGTHWLTHTGLPLAGTTRTNLMWHHGAGGHAIGVDLYTDITWQGERQAHFVANAMSQGAVLIDADGVQKLVLNEATAIPAT